MSLTPDVNRVVTYAKDVAARNGLTGQDRISFYLGAIYGLQVELAAACDNPHDEKEDANGRAHAHFPRHRDGP